MPGKVVTFGEIMLRLAPPGFQRFTQARSFDVIYGGGEANVAVSLANYGIPVDYVTRLPKNDIGEACLQFIRQYGVGTAHIARGGDRLGIYYMETGAAQRGSVVIYDRANSSLATVEPGMIDWKAAFAGADWFHWTGITPAVSKGAADVCLEAVKAARQAGLTVSCDLNYRAKLWKWGKKAGEVMSELVALSDVAIGNEEDADKVFGIRAAGVDVTTGHVSAGAYRFVCEELVKRFPQLKTVAITLRGSLSASHNTWSGVLWHDGTLYSAAQYDITHIVDRVGGGDAFCGGLIYGLKTYGADRQKALEFAVAASCLKHTILGDFNLVSVAEVEKAMGGDTSGRVAREQKGTYLMARFSRLEVLNEIIRIGVVPVFYHADLEVAKNVVAACAAGGARVVEFTNRGDNAYRIFSDLVMHFAKADPSIILGVGSVLDPATAALFISSGANFVVGSVFNPDVARTCNRRKVSYSPGCGSASEISAAEELGVEIVKVFPGDSVGGPTFVKALLGPTPWTRVMPTGGVEATKESITGWFKAGVSAVGIGSSLIKKDLIDAGNYAAMTTATAQVIGWVREARGESLFQGIEHAGLNPFGGASGKEIAEWYGKAFGFKVVEGNSSFFVEGAGPGRIEVMKEGVSDRSHIAVRVADFEAALAALQAKGFEFEEPKVKPANKAAFLKQTDPAGNRVHILWKK